MMDYDGPTYSVTIDGNVCTFNCACGATHTHGRPAKVGVAEHRVAHCVKPTHPHGYYILEPAT